MKEKRMTKMVGYGQQGAWSKWDQIERRKVSWSEFWKTDFSRTKFLVKIVYGLLPSPVNFHVWGKTETPNCPFCPEKGSQKHILSSRKTALAKGPYRWRHDKVLEETTLIITEALQRYTFVPSKRVIIFVKMGTTANKKRKVAQSILSFSYDWQVRVVFGKKLKFPTHMTTPRLRPDVIIYSDSTKQIILVELTVPWEEHIEEAFERKFCKYQELLESCRNNGWCTYCFPVGDSQDSPWWKLLLN